MALGMRVVRNGLQSSTKLPFSWQASQIAMTSQNSCQNLDNMMEVVIARTIETAAFDLVRGAAKKAILEASAEMILTLVKANGGKVQNLFGSSLQGFQLGGPGGGDDPTDVPDPKEPPPGE